MKKLAIALLLVILIFIGLIIGSIFFSWRSDVSNQEPYLYFLNTPLEIKDGAAIVKRTGRFKEYCLLDYIPEQGNEIIATEKVFNLNDTIQFYAAKSYYSIHVDTSYYLIGRDTLSSGEVIEFEYYVSGSSPRVWETLEDFLQRKEEDK